MNLTMQWPQVGLRRMRALILGMPLDCAWRRNGRAWDDRLELQAVAIERADRWLRALAVGQGRKPHDVKPFEPIEHPDRRRVPEPVGERVAAPMSTPQQVQAFFARLGGHARGRRSS